MRSNSPNSIPNPTRINVSLIPILIPILILFLFCPVLESRSSERSHGVSPEENNPNPGMREITGYVSGDGSTLPNVMVSVRNTTREAVTNEKGYYSIMAAEREILVFSYMGLKPIEIIVEDVTRKLDVSLVKDSRMLSEVKLRASANSVDIPEEFDTNYGKVNRKKLGFSSNYLAGENLNLGAIDLVDALRGKIPGYQVFTMNNEKRVQLRQGGGSALWELDGVLFEGEPPYVDLNTIESVNVIKSPGGIARYGSLGSGGVIIIRTLDKARAQRNPVQINPEAGTNVNYYRKDAVALERQNPTGTSYERSLEGVNDPGELLDRFEDLMTEHQDDPSFYLDFAGKLLDLDNSGKTSRMVLEEMQDKFFYDPVGLKSLAYFYQENGMDLEALRVYLRILSLRPEYAQSFRDLASTYRSIGMIEHSWNYYMHYLNKVRSLGESSIGETMYHEMEEIFFRMPRGFRPKETFVSRTRLKDVPKDVRLVFEWDHSEAEFELEFVNPQGQAYSFIHTYEFNDEQINDEKQRGYSSREFVIHELEDKGWLVNLTYYGNKSDLPTYFKVTEIRNWARKGQTEKIDVVKLVEKDKKFQLVRI